MRINKTSISSQLFGSKLKRRILQFLLSDQIAVSERELARIIGVSHTAVNKVMQQLVELNAINGMSIGKALVWSLNKKSFTYPLIQMWFEKLDRSPLEIIKDEISKAIEKKIVEINKKSQEGVARPTIIGAYIFGSVVDGTASPDSDIDVLVILERNWHNEELRKRLGEDIGMNILEKTGNIVSFHIYSKHNVDKNAPPWLEKAVREGIMVC